MSDSIERFVAESNRIEGIMREPTEREIFHTRKFIEREALDISDVVGLVNIYQPDALLRDLEGRNVRVGPHIPPPGGPEIRKQLVSFLAGIGKTNWTPWRAHCFYETLHPFTDGNGRSGRAIWLWMMGGNAPLGFLHQFYYQTLQETRKP